MRVLIVCSLLISSFSFVQNAHSEEREVIKFNRDEVRRSVKQKELDRQRKSFERAKKKNAPTNPGGSVTRMAQGCIEKQIAQGLLKICSVTPGGTAGETVVYFLDGVEFDGKVRQISKDKFELKPKSEVTSNPLKRPYYKGAELPPKFGCGSENVGATSTQKSMQCLVCSCFFEARGVSFPEQVRVARTKHSRVINHRFPGSICANVYYKTPKTSSGGGGAAAYSWTTDKKTYRSKSGAMIDPTDVILGEVPGANMAERDVKSYRSCVHSSAESMHHKDQYFASYYYTKNLDTRGGWIKTCKRNTTHLGEANVVTSALDSEGNPVEFAHLFRRVCEANEISYIPSPFAPRSSLRPMTPNQLKPAGID